MNKIFSKDEYIKSKHRYLFFLFICLYIFSISKIFQNVSVTFKYLFLGRYIIYFILILLLLSNVLRGFKKNNINGNKLLIIFLFTGYLLIIFLFTFVRYDANTALRSLFWYLQGPVLALITPFVIKNKKDLNIIIQIWLIFCVIGAISIVYQYFGGELPWASEIGMRSGFSRFHNTLHSDPNVGGMVSSIVILFSIFFTDVIIWKVILLVSAMILFFAAVSKAGFLGMLIAMGLIVVFFNKKSLLKKLFNKKSFLYLALIFMLLIIFFNFGIIEYFREVGGIIATSALGIGEIKSRASIFDEINYRVLLKTKQGIELLILKSDFPIRDVLIGGSFGLIREGLTAKFRPHNNFLEVFLCGGIIHLLLFLIIIILTTMELYKRAFKDSFYQGLLICFIILISYLFAFPVYTINTLAQLFWLIIGFSAVDVRS